MEALRVERDGHVLRVTLARPERRNAFDAALIAELTTAFADVGDARAVVLAGDGAELLRRRRRRVAALVDRPLLRRERRGRDAPLPDARGDRLLPCTGRLPSSTAMRSAAASGLVACADVAVAHPDTVFGFTEVRLGIIPAVISPFVLPKLGSGRAEVLPHRRAVRRRRRAPDRARARGRGESRRKRSRESSTRSSRRARRPCARRNGSCANRPVGRETARDRGRAPRRATRARTVSGPFSRSGRRPGCRGEACLALCVPGEDDRRRRALDGAVVHRFDVRSVGIQHDRRVVPRVIRPLAGRAVVTPAGCERGRVEAIDGLAIGRLEREVEPRGRRTVVARRRARRPRTSRRLHP